MNQSQTVELVEEALEKHAAEIVGRLFGEVAALNQPLLSESGAKTAEAQRLRESHAKLQRRAEAQQRVFAREIDSLVVQGRDADADRKRQEAADLERELSGILAQAEVCECRVKELERAQKQNYIETYKSAFPQICAQCIEVELTVPRFLNTVWAALLRFQGESGLLREARPVVFVPESHKQLLTPDDRTPEDKARFNALAAWFGFGGVRR